MVFLSCCLRFVSDRGRLLEHSKKNDVTACVLFRGMYILAKETNNSFINLVVTDRGNCIHKNCKHTGKKYKRLNHLAYSTSTTFRQLIMKFRQLLALCYRHYLVSDQDFKKCCDETDVFKLKCTCLHEIVVFEYLRQT